MSNARVGSGLAGGAGPEPNTVTTLLVKDILLRFTLVLIAALLQFGCATRICQTKPLKMQWADGTTSTMKIVVCRPLFGWR